VSERAAIDSDRTKAEVLYQLTKQIDIFQSFAECALSGCKEKRKMPQDMQKEKASTRDRIGDLLQFRETQSRNHTTRPLRHFSIIFRYAIIYFLSAFFDAHAALMWSTVVAACKRMPWQRNEAAVSAGRHLGART
jgi:hypothetical protein